MRLELQLVESKSGIFQVQKFVVKISCLPERFVLSKKKKKEFLGFILSQERHRMIKTFTASQILKYVYFVLYMCPFKNILNCYFHNIFNLQSLQFFSFSPEFIVYVLLCTCVDTFNL